MQIPWIASKKLGNGVYDLQCVRGFSGFTTVRAKAFAYGYGCFATCGEAFKGLGVVNVHAVFSEAERAESTSYL